MSCKSAIPRPVALPATIPGLPGRGHADELEEIDADFKNWSLPAAQFARRARANDSLHGG